MSWCSGVIIMCLDLGDPWAQTQWEAQTIRQKHIVFTVRILYSISQNARLWHFWDCIFKSSSGLEHALLHAFLVFRAFCTRTSTGPSQISEAGAPNLIQRYTPLSWCYVQSYRPHRVRKQVNIRVQNFCIFESDIFCLLKMA